MADLAAPVLGSPGPPPELGYFSITQSILQLQQLLADTASQQQHSKDASQPVINNAHTSSMCSTLPLQHGCRSRLHICIHDRNDKRYHEHNLLLHATEHLWWRQQGTEGHKAAFWDKLTRSWTIGGENTLCYIGGAGDVWLHLTAVCGHCTVADCVHGVQHAQHVATNPEGQCLLPPTHQAYHI